MEDDDDPAQQRTRNQEEGRTERQTDGAQVGVSMSAGAYTQWYWSDTTTCVHRVERAVLYHVSTCCLSAAATPSQAGYLQSIRTVTDC